jgi:hypothetical protein
MPCDDGLLTVIAADVGDVFTLTTFCSVPCIVGDTRADSAACRLSGDGTFSEALAVTGDE